MSRTFSSWTRETGGARGGRGRERRGREEAGDLAALRRLLDLEPLLAGDRAVVRARDLAFGELVQAQGEPLGEPAVVDEDDRGAVLVDEAEQLGVDRRPDRRRRQALLSFEDRSRGLTPRRG